MEAGPLIAAITGILGVLGSTPFVSRLTSLWFRRDVDAERTRLRTEVLGEVVVRQTPEAANSSEDPGTEPPAPDQRFAALLIEYYAYGLAQARRSFAVSLACSVLGGAVLITGVGLAIVKANTNGQQYASVVASVAGVVTTAIGSLFHRRADLALKHMESQTQSLRQDMKVERDAGQAMRLLEEVDDPALKAHLQAALILKFSAAKLPQLAGVLEVNGPSAGVPSHGDVPRPGTSES